MNQQALDYLYKRLKKHKIALGQAETRGDAQAVDNLRAKIDCVEYLIELALKA